MTALTRAFGVLSLGIFGFAACGLSTEGTGNPDPDGGGGVSGTGGSAGVTSNTCFPGSKVCPDPQGEPKCIASSAPDTGCGTTSCEPCALPGASAKCDGEGKCAIDQCDPGFADCDGNPINGCEASLNWAPTTCGNCGTNCQQDNGKVCEEGLCVVSSCAPGTANCNGDKSSCEVDTTSDPNNCGYCTNKCELTNANSACSSSQCVITSCVGAFRDCDSVAANGCEINSATDSSNCGVCGKVCNSTNGVAGCQLGNCVIICTPPYGNCDNNPDNGCETNTQTSVFHCGGCGQLCAPANVNSAVCSNGSCGYNSCQPGWGDCDGNPVNGCERDLTNSKQHCGSCGNACQDPQGGTAVCSNGACASSCTSPQTLCTDTCYNLNNHVNNCGSCGNQCTTTKSNASPSCSGGQCSFTCNSGYTKCDDNCVATQTNPAHCGGCGNLCPQPANSTRTCSGGACGFTCNSGYTKCGNECVSLSSNVSHCGSCNNPCPAPSPGSTGTPVCSGGSCSYTCGTGTTLCSPGSPTGCWNTSTSILHCGACDQPCTGTNRSCVSGSCNCTGGTTECGGACVNTTNNASHCGGCGNECPAPASGYSGDPVCVSSSCTFNCTGGQQFKLCGPQGCTNTNTDKNNCGTCGNVCGGTATCSSGQCGCTAPLIYCGNGCVNPTSDPNNCGKCGCTCTSPANCANGTCHANSTKTNCD